MLIGFSLGAVIIVNLLLAVLVLSRNIGSSTNRLYGLLSLSIIIWSVANYASNNNSGYIPLVFANRFALAAGLSIVAAVWLFVVYFPTRQSHRTQSLIALVLLPFVSALTLFTPYVVRDVTFNDTKQVGDIVTGSLYFIYIITTLIFLGFLFRNFLISYHLKNDRLYRQQVTWTAVGITLSFMWILITSAILPAAIGDWTISKFGPIGSLFLAIFIAYAIIRHRMFNIRLIIARSFAYILSLALLGFAYGFTAFYIIDEWLFKNQAMPLSIRRIVYISLAVIFGLIFAPAKKYFDKISNNIFYRDAYDPQIFIDNLTNELVSNTDIDSLLNASSELISLNLKPEFAEFLLAGNGGQVFRTGQVVQPLSHEEIEILWKFSVDSKEQVVVLDGTDRYSHRHATHFLSEMNVSLVVKLMNRSELRGLLLIGAKRSGNVFNKKDLEIFEIVADELSLAIENSLAYEEIRKFNETLQTEINDATKQLRHTNEKLKALDETKDEFISMASHQLRTPLTSVKGYVSMVLEGDAGELNEQQKKLLTQAFISSQRMVYLISDLLNVSRLRTGKFVIEPTDSSLPDVIESEMEQLKETAQSKGLKLSFNKPDNFPKLHLDEGKIRQVIMNLIDNAIYYTPPGGIIEVELEAKPRSIEFRVLDNGIGVPRAEQHNLFNKFYRAENARKARPDGTGLGLFMAKKVVVAQGGAMIFRSQEGKGSTFGFSFPRHAVEVKEK